MKTQYTHQSGKFIATQISAKEYLIEPVPNPKVACSFLPAEIVENASDWIKMVEVTLIPLYTERQIEKAFRTFLAGIKVHGEPLSFPKVLRFEEIFFQLLLEQKK